MDRRSRSVIALMLALLMLVAMLGISGCSGADEAEETTEAESESTGTEEEADQGGEEMAADEAELEDGALDIAQAWFIGPGSDYATGDVEFAVAAMVQSEDGSWWARVVATPNDASMESEQVYVTLAEGMTLWTAVDSGTGIDPATDDRFPEDVADQLQP